MIHRARLLAVEEQPSMLDQMSRSHVRLVLHTGHVVAGLRVDELHIESIRRDVNEDRREDAERRILAAIEELRRRGEALTVTAIAKASGAHKQTVTKVLGTPVHTPRRDLPYKGMNRVPQSEEQTASASSLSAFAWECPSPDADGRRPCRGGCGKRVPPCQKCSECAAEAVSAWKRAKLKRAG